MANMDFLHGRAHGMDLAHVTQMAWKVTWMSAVQAGAEASAVTGERGCNTPDTSMHLGCMLLSSWTTSVETGP